MNNCHHCGEPSTVLCDYVLGVTSETGLIEMEGSEIITCSRPLCDECRTYAGINTMIGVDTIDLCRDHVDAEYNVSPVPEKKLLIEQRKLQMRLLNPSFR